MKLSSQVEIVCDNLLTPHSLLMHAATLLKTQAGSLPEGKVKIRLESDGSLLDVDEDDVEKVFHHQIISELHQLQTMQSKCVTLSDFEL